MLRGRFGNTSSRPYVEGRIGLPSLNKWIDVSFCFDTGADATLLMPVDSTRLGIDFSDPSHTRKPLYGIGKGVSGIILESAISFRDEDTGELFIYHMPVFAADPCDEIRDAPSLLGRNIIHHWRVLYIGGQNVLEAEMLTAHIKIPLKP
jgi:hypothetical protein